ncbi:MAG: Hpt domain-containing protein [Phycisphaerae bacterium]|nr:Hpt domain-containing protein [Phycisphaerae bacterium]
MPDEGPITSEFANDPDMAILIAEFVASLPKHTHTILERIEQGANEQARTMAHQLKGAGGGYGFPLVTDAARVVELAIREKRMDDARTAAKALITLCARVVS